MMACLKDTRGVWLVMEFGDLGDLQDHIDNKYLSLPEKTRFMYQTASGLSHIHSNRIVHRDLKPQNVILSNQNGRPIAKITDFGEVKIFEGRAAGGMLQELMKTLVGTKFYWAPELFKACKKPNARASKYNASVDVFATGLIFMVILQNGGYPLSGKTVILQRTTFPA